MRPSKDAYYLGIAEAVAQRSTCLRKRYGSVIVKDDEIIATGYNGAPRGEQNCCDIGECARKNYAHGEGYSVCPAVHAEQNAIISASRREMIGATLYLACLDTLSPKPCEICRRMIKNSGISKVVTLEGEMQL
jgi:dCMP deaminase